MASGDTTTPQQLLEIDATTRVALANRLVTPWWYYPALGLLMGGLTASIAIDSPYAPGVAFALFMVGLSVLGAQYQALTGIGRRENPSSRMLVLGLAGVALFVAAVVGTAAAIGGAPGLLLAAVVAFVLAVSFGPRLDAAVRSDLRDTP